MNELVNPRIMLLEKIRNDRELSGFFSNMLSYLLDPDIRILMMGNGGSNSDCDHFVGELIGRYEKNRRSISAINLGANTGAVTCIANDYGYDKVFARQIEALIDDRTVVIAFSTTGNSKNIVEGLRACAKFGIPTFLFTGKNGGIAKDFSTFRYIVPSENTALIQEVHQMIYHQLCEEVDRLL